MKPLMYGYMRVVGEAEDDEIKRIEDALRSFAEVEGFCFATIFHEYDSPGAFDELVEELKRAEARHVIMPSTDDLSQHPFLRNSMLLCLEQGANAHVHTLADRSVGLHPTPSAPEAGRRRRARC